MSRKLVDLGKNVAILNPKAARYHLALENTHNDLYLIFCSDLIPECALFTKEAVDAFIARYRGKLAFMVIPIDPVAATDVSNTVFMAEDVAALPSL